MRRVKAALTSWVRLPNRWIEDGGLKRFDWERDGSAATAALMALTVLAHHVDQSTGVARLTYDELEDRTHLSRAKVSEGLKLLFERGMVGREPSGRGSYQLVGYDPVKDWAKLPCAGLYRNGGVNVFKGFHLRLRPELDALKLYFLFVSRRDRTLGYAKIAYPKREEYSGVPADRIRVALSLLIANGLVVVELVPSMVHEGRFARGYRLLQMDARPYKPAKVDGDAAAIFAAKDVDFDSENLF